ncbi:MAG: Rv1355c family protein [Flavobacteriales bacterium]
MSPGSEALKGTSDTTSYRPVMFRMGVPGNREQLRSLLDTTPGIQVFDEIQAQLEEFVRLSRIGLPPAAVQGAVQEHLQGTSLSDHGVWVYYPWSRRLVHLLDEAEFVAVRTDRNRNKITREEQERLGQLKVGVIGLSVGQSVSLTMALERGFGEIRLADFDRLDLSNLNRIRSGIHSLGLNKVVNVAREIAEIDSFLKVVCFTEGLTKANMDAFFSEGGDLDVLVEECDSVDIKILARQKAKAIRIPVVMDMSDRGVVDVERFDLEPDRPLMHGWIDHLDLDAAGRPMTPEEKVPYMLPISGVETLSARMKASVIELGQTVSAWPQLATSVVLGGALAGDVVRRIALDQFHASGRWFIDLDDLIGDSLASGGDRASGRCPFPAECRAACNEGSAGPACGCCSSYGRAVRALGGSRWSCTQRGQYPAVALRIA